MIFSVKFEIFIFATASSLAVGSAQPLLKGYLKGRGFFPGVERPGREAHLDLMPSLRTDA
jgi:hypothetical protein